MVEQYVGEIKLVGFNFAPYQWAQCAGQILPLSQNVALFSLLGTMYGGNGTSNFALPDLRGRAAGQVGPNLYTTQGEQIGTEGVNINSTTYPAHTHLMNVSTGNGTATAPNGVNYLAAIIPPSPPPPPKPPGNLFTNAAGAQRQPINPLAVGMNNAGNQPHENRMPYLAMTYCIALQGVFPPRS
jgi:microcystin-dependent protein